MGQDEARRGGVRQGRARRDQARQGKTRQGGARGSEMGQGGAWQGQVGQGKAKQGWTGRDVERQGGAQRGKALRREAWQSEAERGKAGRGEAGRVEEWRCEAGRGNSLSLGHAPGCKPRPHQGHAHTPVPPQSIGHTAAYKPLPLPLTTPPSLSHAPIGAKPRPLVRPRPPPGSSCPSRTPKTLLRVPGAVPVPTLSRSRRTPPAERPPPGVPQCHGARGPPNCLGGAKRGGQVVMGGTHGIRGHRG